MSDVVAKQNFQLARQKKTVKESDAVAELPEDVETPPSTQDLPVESEKIDPPEAVKRTIKIEREFKPVTVEEITAAYEPEFHYVDQALTLREMPPTKVNIRQLERAEGRESYQQGRDAERADPETFSISEAGKLDLLVVMDDSTSMDAEQVNLAAKLDQLISKLDNTDWQIGVVTTSDPCLRDNRLIKKSDADRSAAFAKAIGDIVLSNTVIEKGFPMSIKALKGECKGVTNQWLRANAAIGILIVSDEDNCGSHSGEGCPGEQGETVTQMIDYLRSIRPADQAKLYGLFEGANECGTSAFTATKYKSAVEQTGGRWGSICQANYSTTLQQISEDVRKIVKREFVLKFPPDTDTLQLVVDGVAKTSGFTLVGNILTISDLSAADQNLTANYFYGAVKKYKIFKIAGNIDSKSLKVTVNDIPVAAGEFTYDETAKEVIFANEPLDNSVIKVSYRVDTPLPSEFSVANTDILDQPLYVKVANLLVSDYSYDLQTKKVFFASAPRDGEDVEISFRTKLGRVTRYAAALPNPNSALKISVSDRDTGMPISVVVDNSDIVFAADEIVDGRIFDIRYDLGYESQDMTFLLSHEPLNRAVAVDFSDPSCDKKVILKGREVVADCGAGRAGTVLIAYRAVTQIDREFTVDAEFAENAVWEVFIDGKTVTNPLLKDKIVSLPDDELREGSVVKIVVSWTEDVAP
jgi:hypothetical protein